MPAEKTSTAERAGGVFTDPSGAAPTAGIFNYRRLKPIQSRINQTTAQPARAGAFRSDVGAIAMICLARLP